MFTALVERLMILTGKFLHLLADKLGHLYRTFHIRLIHLTIVVSILLLIILFIPAATFCYLERDWNYLDAFYYCFISMTTIGLGDYIPGDKPSQHYRALYKILTTCKCLYHKNKWYSNITWLSGFLGGLSLHLNHLIGQRLAISFRQFGTLPIGIFLSNLDSRPLKTSLMTSYCHFWNLSTFGDSRAVWVFWPKLGVFRKSKFSRWRSNGASMWLGGFR